MGEDDPADDVVPAFVAIHLSFGLSAKRHVPACEVERRFRQSVGFKSVVVYKYDESRVQNRFAGFCRNGFPVLCKDTKITLKSGVYFCFLFGFFVIVGNSGVPQAESGYMRCEIRSIFGGMRDSGCLPDSEISTERSVRWQRESICGSESCCGMNSEKFL